MKLMKRISSIVVTVILFFVGVAGGIALERGAFPVDILPAAGATLLAAFFGARYAFALQESREDKKKQNVDRSAVNHAIYSISRMWNNLSQYKKEIINPAVETKAAWLSMAATIDAKYEDVHFPSEDLLFLLDSGHAQLYSELLLEEQRYQIAIGLIRELSKTTAEKLFPKMEQLGYHRGQDADVNQITKELGPELSQRLNDLTKGVIQNVSENLESLPAIYKKLRSNMEEHFKGKKLIKIEFSLEQENVT